MRSIIAPVALASVITAAAVAVTHAQWLNYPTPGIPRLPDGKANLTAPTPRAADGRPDLSGIWLEECGFSGGRASPCTGQDGARPQLFFDLARDLPPAAVQMTPWATAIQAQRRSRDHVDDPFGYCLPMGVPRMTVSVPFKIITTSGITAFLHETNMGMVFRQIFTDGRPLPVVTEPTWLGYSVGKWDGDTFVVESAGFRDGGWLDTNRGRPHSNALHVTERFRRLDVGHMTLSITINDPKAYLAPWTVPAKLNLMADTELIESFCDGHDKTMQHRRIDPAPPEPPSPALSKGSEK
jgi:hypothetical protein